VPIIILHEENDPSYYTSLVRSHIQLIGYLAVASSVLAKQAPIADHAGEHGNFFSEIVAAAKVILFVFFCFCRRARYSIVFLIILDCV